MLDRKFADGAAVKEWIRQKVVNSSSVDSRNRELYLEWAHSLLAESLSFARVLKYTQVLMTFERFLRKPFVETTRRDMEEAIIAIDHAGYRPHYLHDIKVCVRRFYKWLRHTEHGYPEEVVWIHSVMTKRLRRMLPENLLTEEQIMKLVNATPSVRDRAFIAVLYDVSVRPSHVS